MDKKLKLAVIGAGGIARVAHLPAYKNMDNVELVAICDIIEERAKEKAEEYNIPAVYTDYKDVKTVIFGQDPYHGENQAHGLCFSVKKGVDVPPSLKNIYKELQMEMGLTIPDHGCLEKWAKQGVLLLNSALTVRDGLANSHKNKGWEKVTDRIVSILNERPEPIIFLLWGNDAKKKEELITSPQHIILTAAHPSPLSASRGFMGCGHFAKVNNILKAMNRTEIDWQIE